MRLLMITATALAVSGPAWARQVEVTQHVSYTTSADIDQKALGVQDLTMEGALTWGAQVTYFLTTHLGVGALWTYQSSALRMSTTSATAELFDMTVSQLHATVAYQFRDAGALLRPFVFGGVGATSFSASGLQDESKASWTVGGGLKWFVQRHVGLEVQARYKPTELRDRSSAICDPFGFCQGSLKHLDVGAGAVLRF
jgi:opacity protein-like surface antigen